MKEDRAINAAVPWRIPSDPLPSWRGSPPPATAVRLNANESPFRPPDSVIQAMADAAASCNRYSFGLDGPLLSALASWLDVDAGRLLLTNGSSELIDRVIGALGRPGAEVVYPHPSFPLFSAGIRTSGATGVPVELRKDGGNDLDAMADAVTAATVLIIVCNPNNPTGTHLPAFEVSEFLKRLPPEPLVLLDEAYIEFSDEHGDSIAIDVAAQHRNTLVTRTFSKYFGLAGLRVGYGIATSAELAADIRLHLGSANLGRVALAGALAALDALDVAESRRAFVLAQRARISAACSELGLGPYPSATNFVMCAEPYQGAADEVRSRGLWIRDGASILSTGMIRMTVGSEEDNDRLIAVLRDITGGTA